MIDLKGVFFFSFSFLFNTAAHSLDVWHSVVLDRVVFFFFSTYFLGYILHSCVGLKA